MRGGRYRNHQYYRKTGPVVVPDVSQSFQGEPLSFLVGLAFIDFSFWIQNCPQMINGGRVLK